MERASPHRLVMEILVAGNIIVSRVSLGISRQLFSSTKVRQYEHVACAKVSCLARNGNDWDRVTRGSVVQPRYLSEGHSVRS